MYDLRPSNKGLNNISFWFSILEKSYCGEIADTFSLFLTYISLDKCSNFRQR